VEDEILEGNETLLQQSPIIDPNVSQAPLDQEKNELGITLVAEEIVDNTQQLPLP
jgi:hypothetical protein